MGVSRPEDEKIGVVRAIPTNPGPSQFRKINPLQGKVGIDWDIYHVDQKMPGLPDDFTRNVNRRR